MGKGRKKCKLCNGTGLMDYPYGHILKCECKKKEPPHATKG
jgi:hypothetical protein